MRPLYTGDPWATDTEVLPRIPVGRTYPRKPCGITLTGDSTDAEVAAVREAEMWRDYEMGAK